MRRPRRPALRSVTAVPRRHPRWFAVGTAMVVAAVMLVTVVQTTSVRRVDAVGALPGVSLFDRATVPQTPTDPDRRAVEVGVRVRFAVPGAVTAIAFYRGPQNLGRRVGHLWSADGRLLSRVDFPADGGKGWQTAMLPSPVGARAGSEYVVSYFAPEGGYSSDVDYFAGRSIQRGPLTAPAGRNGVYRYGGQPGFPTMSWRSSNYYVDLVFDTGIRTPPPPGPTSAAPTASARPSQPAPAPTAGTLSPLPTSAAPVPPTTTVSPSSSPALGSGTFPGPSDTGVPAGRALKEVQGDYHVRTAGAVVQDLLIRGSLYIEADNVTVRYVEARCTNSYWVVRDQGRNTMITDSTFTVDRSTAGAYCQYGITAGDGATLLRNDVSYTANGLTFAGGSALVQDNWVHDQMAYPGKDNHVDAALLSGGGAGPYVFRHNYLSVPMAQTGALAMYSDFGQIRNVLADRNLFEGGGYSVYGGRAGSANVRFTNNSFSRAVFPRGGFYGPVTAFDPSGAGNVWSGNVWADTGAPVSP